MPPPIAEHQKRFTANPARPARYRPGKGVTEDNSSEEEEDEEEEVQEAPKPAKKPAPRSAAPKRAQAAPEEEEEEEEDDDEEGFVTDEDDEDEQGAPVSKPVVKSVAQATRPPQPVASTQPSQTKSGQEEAESASDESEEESEAESESESEEESSSEDEAPQRKFQRPTFIKKTDRKAVSTSEPLDESEQKSTPGLDLSSSHHDESTTSRRLAEAENLIKLNIERDTAARLAGKKSWDDDDDLPPEALVDDTDGLDPQAEHSAWRLRELHRLKRDRETMIAREKELEEIERRRNLTTEEREAEDREYISKQKEERDEGRGKAGFLSKYHHKGAFFLDDETSARLAKRDLVGAKFADDVTDKSALPEYMRMRDMTKLGKKGRTRYTDLKGQDTGNFGHDVKRWRGSGYDNDRDRRNGEDLRGVDERFLPDDERDRRSGGGPAASGANASAIELGEKTLGTATRIVHGHGHVHVHRQKIEGGERGGLTRVRGRGLTRLAGPAQGLRRTSRGDAAVLRRIMSGTEIESATGQGG